MKESKHTPGPWVYRKWSNHSAQNLLEGFSISSDDRLVPMNTSEGDIYEAEENARLIAAARIFWRLCCPQGIILT